MSNEESPIERYLREEAPEKQHGHNFVTFHGQLRPRVLHFTEPAVVRAYVWTDVKTTPVDTGDWLIVNPSGQLRLLVNEQIAQAMTTIKDQTKFAVTPNDDWIIAAPWDQVVQ